MNTNRPIILYTWKDTKLNQINPKIRLIAMEDNQLGYDPQENARQLGRLFAISLPGNTLDVFYKSLADEIRLMLDSPEKVEILKSPYDLENRLRIAINQLIEGDN